MLLLLRESNAPAVLGRIGGGILVVFFVFFAPPFRISFIPSQFLFSFFLFFLKQLGPAASLGLVPQELKFVIGQASFVVSSVRSTGFFSPFSNWVVYSAMILLLR